MDLANRLTRFEKLAGTASPVREPDNRVLVTPKTSFSSTSGAAPQFQGQFFKGLFKTLTYQNLLFCRVPINPILGCIIRSTKNKV